MASFLSPFPSPLFSEANPPWPTTPPPEHSFDYDYVILIYLFITILCILCCYYPQCKSAFRRITQRRALRVVIEEELKTFQYTAEAPVGKNSDCCVCMEEFTAGDFCKMLGGCGHSFHDQCITQWLKINPHCPICRTKISDSDESSPTSDSPRRPPV